MELVVKAKGLQVQKDGHAGAEGEGNGNNGKGKSSGSASLSYADRAAQAFGDKIVNRLWQEFSIDEREMAIMAALFNMLLDGDTSVKATRLLTKVFSKPEVMGNIFRLSRLMDKGLITVSVPRSNWGSDRMINYMESKVSLTEDFLRLMTFGSAEKKAYPSAYKDGEVLVCDIKRMGEMLDELSEDRNRTFRESYIPEREGWRIFDEFMDTMLKRIELTGDSLPMTAFFNREKLEKKEAMIVLLIFYREFLQRDFPPGFSWILPRISRSISERISNAALLSKDARLVKKGIILVYEIDNHFGRKESVIRLDHEARKELAPELDPDDLLKKGRGLEKLVKEGDFFELLTPVQSIEKVILPASTSKTLNEVVTQIKAGVWKTLHKWGISPQPAGAKNKKEGNAATILFYGPPGTGKTHAALAIAGALKKQIVTVDCSKILGKYVGDSEKNTRKIFEEYRRVCGNVKNAPILLLNEADQFFQRRLAAERSTDRMYNQMQNILLEEMERFQGTLIATTNLMDDFDPAFSRRFHYKVRFERPGKDERERLWRLHLPENAPLSSDINLKAVAEAFDLSGGQIALVVKNAAVRAAIRDEGDRFITQEDLIQACEEEVRGNFDQTAKMAMGF